MKEVTEKYYQAYDGQTFTDESECLEYEDALDKVKALKSQAATLNKELACAEYVLHRCKKILIKRAGYAGGCGHDGYYHKCPDCGELVGGYEGRNTSLKVDENTYRCVKCGEFFIYS